MRVILDAVEENPEPRRCSAFAFLFLRALALLRVNAPYFGARGVPALALSALLHFHCPPKQRIRNRAFRRHKYLKQESAGQSAAASALKNRRPCLTSIIFTNFL